MRKPGRQEKARARRSWILDFLSANIPATPIISGAGTMKPVKGECGEQALAGFWTCAATLAAVTKLLPCAFRLDGLDSPRLR